MAGPARAFSGLVRGAGRRYRQARMLAQAWRSGAHPILAQIVPIRRCNLACTYCNEFDQHGTPVATAEMLARVDRLAALGTTMVDVSGGEPLLHPELEAIVAGIRRRGMVAGLLTNGYLLSDDRIRRLNRAGLDHAQISIDNLAPDRVSKKSLSVLEPKLALLARRAAFDVNVNTVVGAGVRHPGDALVIARRALELGFTATVGLIHDGTGSLVPLGPAERRAYEEIRGLAAPRFSVAQRYEFQRNLAAGRPNAWHCRAGQRYVYVCEEGLVHWCSQQRGRPGVPLAEYTREDLAREGTAEKPCAPYCTISCVHRVALLDDLRERPLETVHELMADDGGRLPAAVQALLWMFVTGRRRHLFRRVACRVFGVR